MSFLFLKFSDTAGSAHFTVFSTVVDKTHKHSHPEQLPWAHWVWVAFLTPSLKPTPYPSVRNEYQSERQRDTVVLNLLTCLDKKWIIGLPWWRSGWESARQCRGHGFEPWSGKIPHAAERLGPWATTAEPARLEPVLRNKRGRDSERPAHRDEERPPLAATRESPRTETKTQNSHK